MENEDIQILPASSVHTDQVILLIRESFFPREPLLSALKLAWQEYDEGLWSKIGVILNKGCSFVALDSSGRAIGCRLSTMKEIERNKDPEPDYITIDGESEKIRILRSLFRALMTGWTKELPDCVHAFEFILMTVRKEYAGKRIAEEMVRRSLALAEEKKADYVYTVGTNCRSQRVFDKLGFVTLRTKNYDEFLDETGNPILKMTDGSTCMKWMVKKLKK